MLNYKIKYKTNYNSGYWHFSFFLVIDSNAVFDLLVSFFFFFFVGLFYLKLKKHCVYYCYSGDYQYLPKEESKLLQGKQDSQAKPTSSRPTIIFSHEMYTTTGVTSQAVDRPLK